MKLWLDAQLSPAMAPWIAENFGVDCSSVRDVGLRNAEDIDIFQAARTANVVVISKDSDFPDLIEQLGPPPQVLWITCGNYEQSCSQGTFSKVFANGFGLATKVVSQLSKSTISFNDKFRRRADRRSVP